MELFILNIKDITQTDIEFIKEKFPKRYSVSFKMKNKEDFLRSIGVYILLNKAIKGFKEEEIEVTLSGKPKFKNNDKISFNYSHSGDFIALITSNNDVGIDIENINLKKNVFINRIFSKNEIDEINKDKSLYFKYWTKKEAYLKCIGKGLTLMMNRIDTFKIDDFYFKTYKNDDYYLTICSKDKIEISGNVLKLYTFKEI